MYIIGVGQTNNPYRSSYDIQPSKEKSGEAIQRGIQCR